MSTDMNMAEVREIAREIVAESGPAIAREAAWQVIREHVDSCPIAADVQHRLESAELQGQVKTWKILAIVLAGGSLAGGVSAGALRLVIAVLSAAT